MSAPARLPHVPERTCVACRRKRPQGEFVRVTRTAQGWVLAKRREGRGAYVCADSPACWQDKRLRRAFGASAQNVAAALAARQGAPTSPSFSSSLAETPMTG